MHRHETIHTGLMTADELIEKGISFSIPGGAQLAGLRRKGSVLHAEYYLCSHEVVRDQIRNKPPTGYAFRLRRAKFWDRDLHPNVGYTLRIPTRDGRVRMHLELEASCRPIGRNVPDTPAPFFGEEKTTGTPVLI